MNTPISLIFGSIFSLGCLDEINSEQQLESILTQLNVELIKYNVSSPDNILIEFPNDFSEYTINGQNFQDILLNLVEDDFGKWQYYLSELEKIIGRYINYKDTNSLLHIAKTYDSPFPILYLFVSEIDIIWPEISNANYTSNWNHTLTLNSKLIANQCTDVEKFVNYCQKNFEFIEFHEDILSTIRTIQGASYKDILNTVLHALNVLNQAYHLISTEPNQNLQDLNTIVQLSDNLGLRLNCTRQGRNKVEREFNLPCEINKTGKEVINCEYHLKIDHYDSGLPTANENKIRIYFGLKSYQELPRKRLIVAHIGKHL
ncbi:hypothetical protein [Acinetobacter radioresistens]|uniref:hypothetical protein n=1 Tax=Acinetobacter radioresistens TaxID=40216 RepID=UPI000DACCB43|nr:hypothetical protein [Acinetobacter radioresistens]AWV86171.1 hypothetical protein DOM24_06110 [Acinetobacter radioresistens]MCX0327691.1 hypothetical protein [Acinetobacter radioresistens]